MRTFANILIAFPGEIKNDIDETLAMLDEIKPTIVSFNQFIPYPGTDMYNELNIDVTKEQLDIFLQSADIVEKELGIKFGDPEFDYRKMVSVNHLAYNNPFKVMFQYTSLKNTLKIIFNRNVFLIKCIG